MSWKKCFLFFPASGSSAPLGVIALGFSKPNVNIANLKDFVESRLQISFGLCLNSSFQLIGSVLGCGTPVGNSLLLASNLHCRLGGPNFRTCSTATRDRNLRFQGTIFTECSLVRKSPRSQDKVAFQVGKRQIMSCL